MTSVICVVSLEYRSKTIDTITTKLMSLSLLDRELDFKHDIVVSIYKEIHYYN